MSERAKPLEELVRELPADRQNEVRDFVEFLLAKDQGHPRGKPTFAWAGGLKELRDEYTSVELQHEIARWRIGAK